MNNNRTNPEEATSTTETTIGPLIDLINSTIITINIVRINGTRRRRRHHHHLNHSSMRPSKGSRHLLLRLPFFRTVRDLQTSRCMSSSSPITIGNALARDSRPTEATPTVPQDHIDKTIEEGIEMKKIEKIRSNRTEVE
ncbi:unnamed protein product [Caenorhabditis auriculariae]|uniref:Uncharacterized protein n=1 Tax=Caenorhabditis auriculariae TaxID=2777116 RepID=A0A8S1GQR9_9PELO|nr:unnamed protein product [Caenorhabditis auriculariae]